MIEAHESPKTNMEKVFRRGISLKQSPDVVKLFGFPKFLPDEPHWWHNASVLAGRSWIQALFR